jgi:hypothetical protein
MKSLTLFLIGLAVSIPGAVWLLCLIMSRPEGSGIYQEYPGQTICVQVLLFAGYSLLYWANVVLWRKGR